MSLTRTPLRNARQTEGGFNLRPAADAEERTELKHYVIAFGIALAGIAIIIAAHVRFA